MSNAVVQYEAAIARLKEIARELQTSELGRLLKFAKGTYSIGDDAVPVGTEMIAHVNQLAHGWVKFEDGKVTDQQIGKPAEGFRMPLREELDDQDEASWERDAAGRPRDPWAQQYYLPMEAVETGDVAVFVTGSHGGRGALGKVINRFARNAKNGLPIIKLAVASYKHRTYGRIETPDFPIVGWTESAVAPLVPASPNGPTLEPVGASNADLNDEIPF
jgi:hypothetical protein